MTNLSFSRPFLRVVAGLVMICLLCSSAQGQAYAQAPSEALFSPPASLNLKTFALPKELGTIQDVFVGKTPEAPVVFLIQDAHAIPQAQRSIEKITGYLQDQSAIEMVGLEGACSKLDARLLRSFPDQKALREVLDGFTSRGEFPGALSSMVFHQRPVDFYGLEDWDVYQEGIARYGTALKMRSSLLEKISRKKKAVDYEKTRVYSRELLELDKYSEAFESHSGNFDRFLEFLARFKKPDQGSVLSALLGQITSDSDNAFVTKVLKKNYLKILGRVKDPDEQKKVNQKWQDYQTSDLSPEETASFLLEVLTKQGIHSKEIQMLNTLSERGRKVRQMEMGAFSREFQRYVESVWEILLKSTAQRNLHKQDKMLNLFQKWARLELSWEDWQEIQGGTWPREWDGLFENQKAFYENAEERDRVFLKNLEKLLSSTKSKRMALIAGGFHGQGLKRLLEEKGISFAVVMPAVDMWPETSRYEELMRGEVSWKSYLKPERHRVSLYGAFMRAVRDQLLRGSKSNRAATLKVWRDNLIRGLAAEKQIGKSENVVRFLDEAARVIPASSSRSVRKINRLIAGIRELERTHRFTQADILKLLQSQMTLQAMGGTASFDPEAFLPASDGLNTVQRSELRSGDDLPAPPDRENLNVIKPASQGKRRLLSLRNFFGALTVGVFLLIYAVPFVQKWTTVPDTKVFVFYGTHDVGPSGEADWGKVRTFFNRAVDTLPVDKRGARRAILVEELGRDVRDWLYGAAPRVPELRLPGSPAPRDTEPFRSWADQNGFPRQKPRSLTVSQGLALLNAYENNEGVKEQLDLHHEAFTSWQTFPHEDMRIEENYHPFRRRLLEYFKSRRVSVKVFEKGTATSDILGSLAREYFVQSADEFISGKGKGALEDFLEAMRRIHEASKIRDEALGGQIAKLVKEYPGRTPLLHRGARHQENHELIFPGQRGVKVISETGIRFPTSGVDFLAIPLRDRTPEEETIAKASFFARYLESFLSEESVMTELWEQLMKNVGGKDMNALSRLFSGHYKGIPDHPARFEEALAKLLFREKIISENVFNSLTNGIRATEDGLSQQLPVNRSEVRGEEPPAGENLDVIKPASQGKRRLSSWRTLSAGILFLSCVMLFSFIWQWTTVPETKVFAFYGIHSVTMPASEKEWKEKVQPFFKDVVAEISLDEELNKGSNRRGSVLAKKAILVEEAFRGVEWLGVDAPPIPVLNLSGSSNPFYKDPFSLRAREMGFLSPRVESLTVSQGLNLLFAYRNKNDQGIKQQLDRHRKAFTDWQKVPHENVWAEDDHPFRQRFLAYLKSLGVVTKVLEEGNVESDILGALGGAYHKQSRDLFISGGGREALDDFLEGARRIDEASKLRDEKLGQQLAELAKKYPGYTFLFHRGERHKQNHQSIFPGQDGIKESIETGINFPTLNVNFSGIPLESRTPAEEAIAKASFFSHFLGIFLGEESVMKELWDQLMKNAGEKDMNALSQLFSGHYKDIPDHPARFEEALAKLLFREQIISENVFNSLMGGIHETQKEIARQFPVNRSEVRGEDKSFDEDAQAPGQGMVSRAEKNGRGLKKWLRVASFLFAGLLGGADLYYRWNAVDPLPPAVSIYYGVHSDTPLAGRDWKSVKAFFDQEVSSIPLDKNGRVNAIYLHEDVSYVDPYLEDKIPGFDRNKYFDWRRNNYWSTSDGVPLPALEDILTRYRKIAGESDPKSKELKRKLEETRPSDEYYKPSLARFNWVLEAQGVNPFSWEIVNYMRRQKGIARMGIERGSLEADLLSALGAGYKRLAGEHLARGNAEEFTECISKSYRYAQEAFLLRDRLLAEQLKELASWYPDIPVLMHRGAFHQTSHGPILRNGNVRFTQKAFIPSLEIQNYFAPLGPQKGAFIRFVFEATQDYVPEEEDRKKMFDSVIKAIQEIQDFDLFIKDFVSRASALYTGQTKVGLFFTVLKEKGILDPKVLETAEANFERWRFLPGGRLLQEKEASARSEVRGEDKSFDEDAQAPSQGMVSLSSRAMSVFGWVGIVLSFIVVFGFYFNEIFLPYLMIVPQGLIMISLTFIAGWFKNALVKWSLISASTILFYFMPWTHPLGVSEWAQMLISLTAIFLGILWGEFISGKSHADAASALRRSMRWVLTYGIIGRIHLYGVFTPFMLSIPENPIVKMLFDLGVASVLINAPFGVLLSAVFAEDAKVWEDLVKKGPRQFFRTKLVKLLLKMYPLHFFYWFFPLTGAYFFSGSNPYIFVTIHTAFLFFWVTWVQRAVSSAYEEDRLETDNQSEQPYKEVTSRSEVRITIEAEILKLLALQNVGALQGMPERPEQLRQLASRIKEMGADQVAAVLARVADLFREGLTPTGNPGVWMTSKNEAIDHDLAFAGPGGEFLPKLFAQHYEEKLRGLLTSEEMKSIETGRILIMGPGARGGREVLFILNMFPNAQIVVVDHSWEVLNAMAGWLADPVMESQRSELVVPPLAPGQIRLYHMDFGDMATIFGDDSKQFQMIYSRAVFDRTLWIEPGVTETWLRAMAEVLAPGGIYFTRYSDSFFFSNGYKIEFLKDRWGDTDPYQFIAREKIARSEIRWASLEQGAFEYMRTRTAA